MQPTNIAISDMFRPRFDDLQRTTVITCYSDELVRRCSRVPGCDAKAAAQIARVVAQAEMDGLEICLQMHLSKQGRYVFTAEHLQPGLGKQTLIIRTPTRIHCYRAKSPVFDGVWKGDTEVVNFSAGVMQALVLSLCERFIRTRFPWKTYLKGTNSYAKSYEKDSRGRRLRERV